jgi:hypothetical protein
MSLALRNLDRFDRREFWQTLERLTPQRRLEFLRWACREVSGQNDGSVTVRSPHGRVYITSGDGSMGQMFADLGLLEMEYGLPFAVMADELVRWVRRA